jgi:anthranilate/para-aminobenzoate synthase component II
MILLVNLCKEKLHELEFVKPIEDILKNHKIKYLKRNYKKIKKGDYGNISKIIICGTSLSDNEFIKDINYFRWIEKISKPVLGICGGMQIIGLVFDLEKQVNELDIKNDFKHILKKRTEIGFYKEEFNKDFLGIKGKNEVYYLHNNYINFDKLNDFNIFCKSGRIAKAVKHKEKALYGVLFHPEVRQKHLIKNFCLL